jgi:CRP-like cAMP-binding protein
MALIDHSDRSATVTAETPLRCLLFVSWIFCPFAMDHPETASALLETMVQRVRDAQAR